MNANGPFKVGEVANINSDVRNLLQMDSRIRLYPMFGDVEEDKGYFVTKDHIYFPYVLPKIEHDIAHLIELKNRKRWVMADWGMPRFEKETLAHKTFFAALSREIRTRAIQLHIEKFENEESKLRSTSWNQFNNQYWKDMAIKLCPFGRFDCFSHCQEWADDLRARTFKAWSKDRIIHEWKVRLTHIQNWMETASCHTETKAA